jgi:hypothetical protein
VIQPDSRFRSGWNVALAFFILYCGIAVPLEIAFEPDMVRPPTTRLPKPRLAAQPSPRSTHTHPCPSLNLRLNPPLPLPPPSRYHPPLPLTLPPPATAG